MPNPKVTLKISRHPVNPNSYIVNFYITVPTESELPTKIANPHASITKAQTNLLRSTEPITVTASVNQQTVYKKLGCTEFNQPSSFIFDFDLSPRKQLNEMTIKFTIKIGNNNYKYHFQQNGDVVLDPAIIAKYYNKQYQILVANNNADRVPNLEKLLQELRSANLMQYPEIKRIYSKIAQTLISLQQHDKLKFKIFLDKNQENSSPVVTQQKFASKLTTSFDLNQAYEKFKVAVLNYQTKSASKLPIAASSNISAAAAASSSDNSGQSAYPSAASNTTCTATQNNFSLKNPQYLIEQMAKRRREKKLDTAKQNIKQILDKVFSGDAEAYKKFICARLNSNILGHWQLIDTLKYLCDKATANPALLLNCYPELLFELASQCTLGLYEAVPEVNHFVQIIKKAANQENRNSQVALMIIDDTIPEKKLISKDDLYRLATQVTHVEKIANKSTQDYLYLGFVKNRLMNADEGTTEEYSNTVDFIEKAAKNGSTTAMYYLANMISQGHAKTTVTPHHRKKMAAEFYKMAADLGYIIAIYHLGCICITNINGHVKNKSVSIDQSSENGIDLIEIAANLDYPPAISDLGWLYSQGQAGKKLEPNDRYKKSIALFEKAALLGDPDAMYHLAEMNLAGLAGIEFEPYVRINNAATLLRKALYLGHINAMNRYGEILKSGLVLDESGFQTQISGHAAQISFWQGEPCNRDNNSPSNNSPHVDSITADAQNSLYNTKTNNYY